MIKTRRPEPGSGVSAPVARPEPVCGSAAPGPIEVGPVVPGWTPLGPGSPAAEAAGAAPGLAEGVGDGPGGGDGVGVGRVVADGVGLGDGDGGGGAGDGDGEGEGDGDGGGWGCVCAAAASAFTGRPAAAPSARPNRAPPSRASTSGRDGPLRSPLTEASSRHNTHSPWRSQPYVTGRSVPQAYHGERMAAAERVAIVTGASSGIGEATARVLARAGFRIVAGARRVDRLESLEATAGATHLPLDVRDLASIERFVQEVEARFSSVSVLVNNAGLAAGLEPVAAGDDADWTAMLDTNVLGLLRMTRACLPLLRKAEHAHIVNLGSVAGFEVYAGGAGYTASKHAVRAVSRTLRIELNGEPIRITEVDPGMVETEFSLVRFKGDAGRAAAVYRGVRPLTAGDVADAIGWAVTRPPHVNIDEIVMRPVQQANAFTVHRGPLRGS